MRIIKRVIAILLNVAVTAGVFCGISVNADSAPTNTFEVNDSTVKILGRSFMQDGYLCFSYGNGGIDVNFTGTDFYIDVAQLDGANSSTDIMVLVDTLMPMEAAKYTVTSATGWLCVASGLSVGEHSIRIMKMCRGIGAGGGFGTDWFGIRAIGINGGEILAPDAKSDIIIEAYGDSITNGDAVWLNADGTNSGYSWGAYSGVVARLLNADIYTVGNTGNGLNSWCLGAGNLFPPRESWTSYDPRAGQEYAVDHSDTDAVIINLGTNDMVAIGNTTDPECEQYTEAYFKESYISWLEQIHEDAPNAIVIGALGAMGADILFDDIRAAVDYVNAEFNETYAYFVQLEKCTDISDGTGYDGGHPSNTAHEVYGAQIAEIISDALGLDYGESEEPRGTNLALNKTVIYDSVKEGSLAANVNDGDDSTYWQSNASGTDADNTAYVGIELGNAAEFDNARIIWGTIASAAGYALEYSTDGTTYTAVANMNVSRDGSIDNVTFDSVSAASIRIVITGMDGKNTNPSICEFEVYNSAETIIDKTVNLALSATAIDSGDEYYSEENTAAAAIDGNISTAWQYKNAIEAEGTTWLGVELTAATLLEKTVIVWETATRCTQGGYVIQYSSDGTAWTNAAGASYTYGSDNNGTATDIVTFNGITARYIRIVCNTATDSKYSPKIFELEVYA